MHPRRIVWVLNNNISDVTLREREKKSGSEIDWKKIIHNYFHWCVDNEKYIKRVKVERKHTLSGMIRWYRDHAVASNAKFATPRIGTNFLFVMISIEKEELREVIWWQKNRVKIKSSTMKMNSLRIKETFNENSKVDMRMRLYERHSSLLQSWTFSVLAIRTTELIAIWRSFRRL